MHDLSTCMKFSDARFQSPLTDIVENSSEDNLFTKKNGKNALNEKINFQFSQCLELLVGILQK